MVFVRNYSPTISDTYIIYCRILSIKAVVDSSIVRHNMSVQQAKVKSAISGDTLVLASVNNPEQERVLSLAFVSAPRLKREGDEVSGKSLMETCG